MKQPNIVVIITDQQSASMLSCAGNPWLQTPAMDRLAAHGVRFTNAYCTNPVCLPSRFSLLTGRMPSHLQLVHNEIDHLDGKPTAICAEGLGWRLRDAGYDAAYAGRTHMPHMSPPDLGFEFLTRDDRDGLAPVCVDYIRAARERPFFLKACFVNPHDICYMALRAAATGSDRAFLDHAEVPLGLLDRAMAMPPGVDEETFFAEHCPPLPANFEPQIDEPAAIGRLLDRRAFRRWAREHYSERDWRRHRWAYCRLTEMVDAQLEPIVSAVLDGPRAEDTIIVFSSDHGDMDGVHRLEHKTALYEASCRVPLIIAAPACVRAGSVDDHLVSNGLDLVPTIGDFAGAAVPADLPGCSLRPLVDGSRPKVWRDYLPLESQTGLAVVSRSHKYIAYEGPERQTNLFDLVNDPGETRDAAADATQADALAQHRQWFGIAFTGA